MKIFYLIISFVVVRVSTYNIVDYIKDVVITNAYFEVAYSMNNITIKDNVLVANGLEHIIKKIVGSNDYGLGMMNNMFAIPEYRYLNNWNVCKNIQRTLRTAIQNELNIAVPDVPHRNIFAYTLFAGFSTLYLIDLGAERRNLTGKALKNILNRIINYGEQENVTNLLEERRRQGTYALENRIIRALAGPEEEKSLLWMCHLIALFMGTQFPESYIRSIQINSNDTCILNDSTSTKKTYRKIEGQWCEVIANDLDNEELQPLKEQLL